MPFCGKCGIETKVNMLLCPKCNESQVDYKYKIVTLKEEKLAIIWLFVSFFLPLIGFILFTCWGYGRPKASFYTLIGTIAGSVTVFTVISIITVLHFGGR